MISPEASSAPQDAQGVCWRSGAAKALTSWHVLPGVTGRYSAHASPDELAADIRQFFRPLRPTIDTSTDQEK